MSHPSAALIDLAKSISSSYLSVFGQCPTWNYKTLASGVRGILVSGWLLVIPTGVGDRHVVRAATEEMSPWFSRYPCLSETPEAEANSLENALAMIVMLEAHRRLHVSLEAKPLNPENR